MHLQNQLQRRGVLLEMYNAKWSAPGMLSDDLFVPVSNQLDRYADDNGETSRMAYSGLSRPC